MAQLQNKGGNMEYPKLETIPFNTIAKVVDNCITIESKREITEKLFNEHMKDKLRKEWQDFPKWKESFPKCFAYFVDGKLFKVE